VRALLRRRSTYLIGIPVLVIAVALLAPVVYVNFIKSEPPARLSFADADRATTTSVAALAAVEAGPTTTAAVTTTTAAGATSIPRRAAASTTAPPSPIEGRWRVGPGSLSGYRVGEYLGLTRSEAVGRTDKVTGEFIISGTTVASGSWTVDMASVKSDDDRRDQNYRRVMEVEEYPTSTFVLASPIALNGVPDDGSVVTRKVTGAFTMHGQTKTVTFDVNARRKSGRVEVLGTIRVNYTEYGVQNPSNGYARADDEGDVEFLLLFDRS
jgi:polyisoprenoid-binding protein YceI